MIRYLFDFILNPKMKQRQAEYSKFDTIKKIKGYQLIKFNQEWEKIKNSVPYFCKLRENKKLPEQFGSLDEITKLFPIMTKDILQNNINEMSSSQMQPDYFRRTGGTTAEPIKIPSYKQEINLTTPDFWIGRNWYKIKPSDKLFLLWGHSHLLGEGITGWLNGKKRQIKDFYHGYYRYPAYDMSYRAMRKAGREILKFRPSYIIGYSVALDRLARVNKDLKDSFMDLKLKVVIGTAESFPQEESQKFISDVFGCPIAMEYGAAELGVMAHTYPEIGYKVFWQNFLIEAIPSDRYRIKKIIITSLYPRCVPFIRYEIGDEILIKEKDMENRHIYEFDAVIGRCNDYVTLDNGILIHSEAFTHAVKFEDSIIGYQIIQNDSKICLNYVSLQSLVKKSETKLKNRLCKINPMLKKIELCHVDRLERSMAGKTPMILRYK